MQNTANNSKNNDIDISEIIYDYTRHWKWFLISICALLFIGGIIILTSEKQFSTSISVLLNEDQNKPDASSLMNLEAIGLMSTTSNIDNEIAIFSSPDLIYQVIDTLNAQVSYYVKSRLRRVEIHTDKPFTVKYNESPLIPLKQIDVKVVKENGKYNVSGTFKKMSGDGCDFSQDGLSFPTAMTLPDGLGVLNFEPGVDSEKYNEWNVEILNLASATLDLRSKLGVTPSGKKSSVIEISVNVGNSDKGADILKELVRQYNELNVQVKNELAQSTSLFVNDRLREIAIELNDIEREVVDYKQQNKITNINAESKLFVEQSGMNEQKMMETETQINVLSMIDRFVKDPVNKYAMIPNLDISDPGLSQIINAYNTKLLVNEQLLRNTGDENPSKKRIQEDIDNTRGNIIGALKNVKSTYQVIKENLQKQSRTTQSRIVSVPQQEKGLLEKVRLQQVKESLFLFLMQKREETAISIASTADKARVIVSPTLQAAVIAPNMRNIILFSFILGVLIPIAFIYISNLLKTKITSQVELEKLSNVSVIGQICKNTVDDHVVVRKNDVTPISEMFRSVRNNLNFILKHEDHKIILITSTASGEGKSFVSLNLALSFALLDKKVLIIGADVRKPKLKIYVGLDGRKGLTDYLISSSDNWSEFIHRAENSTLDVMISGTIPPNPNELLTNPKLKTLLKDLKSEYDIVILDTAPVGLVSDTYLLEQYADIILYITRENMTLKTSVEFINKQKEEESLHNMYLLLNDTNLNNRYGYRYGYGKGYGYGQQKEK